MKKEQGEMVLPLQADNMYTGGRASELRGRRGGRVKQREEGERERKRGGAEGVLQVLW